MWSLLYTFGTVVILTLALIGAIALRRLLHRCSCPIHTGQYALLEKLGSGTHSEVWLVQAKRPHLTSPACKALKTEGSRSVKHARVQFQVPGQGGNGDDMCAIKVITIDQMDDANRGMEIAVKLSQLHHCNVVEVRQQFLHSAGLFRPYQFCIVMELCTRGTLRDILNDSPTGLDILRALNILQQLISGLAAIHDLGIIHSDIKPDNIFLGEHRSYKIGDPGLAQHLTLQEQTASRNPGYLAPEVMWAKGRFSAAADIWSMGIVLLEMVYGFGNALLKSMSDEMSPDFPSITAGFTYLGEDTAIRRICELSKLKRKRGMDKLLMHLLSLDPAKRMSAKELELELVDMNSPESPSRSAPLTRQYSM